MAGSPRHKTTKTTRAYVVRMSSVGVNQVDIAAVLDISPTTLIKYYRKDLHDERTENVGKVAGALLKSAIDGNVTSMIFYLKTQGGWREIQHHEHSGPDGDAIAITDARAQLLALVERTRDAPKFDEPDKEEPVEKTTKKVTKKKVTVRKKKKRVK